MIPNAAKGEVASSSAAKADTAAVAGSGGTAIAPATTMEQAAPSVTTGDATPSGHAKSAAAVPTAGKGDFTPPVVTVDTQRKGDFTDGANSQSSLPSVAFFLLLHISAAMGTGLRMLVAYQSNEIARLTLFAVGIELVIAMSVAFGLALFYLIGGISFTGQVVALVPDSQMFSTIAVAMSLLGLAAGYLVPLDKLRDRLQKIFAEDR